ncbi:hypothetical protein [Massilia sp. 9096]|uniref:hypothetical protein n=1 Tax=Massilia sp. 9096 TaxID=1500894 RepID=UPI0005667B38|nr:hypothetical protein [Massilia sp. 9096]
MNSFNPSSNQRSSLDALFDKIEHDLLALTTASLDAPAPPRQTVDEFANEFLGHWLMPPRRRLTGI